MYIQKFTEQTLPKLSGCPDCQRESGIELPTSHLRVPETLLAPTQTTLYKPAINNELSVSKRNVVEL